MNHASIVDGNRLSYGIVHRYPHNDLRALERELANHLSHAESVAEAVAREAFHNVAFFDVYDIKTECAHPKLLNSIGGTDGSIPANVIGHEGGWSPDGMTYWSTSLFGGSITAIDVSDPTLPHILYTGYTSLANHGFSLSNDGNRLYMGNAIPEGLIIFDTSAIQNRSPVPPPPVLPQIGSVTWTDGAVGQHTIPITYGGQPYLVYVDEGGAGAARIIDIGDETAPRVISKLKLEIHMPDKADMRSADTANNGFFGYEGHYCEVDRNDDPTALACGYFQSGVRVFDIRDPMKPHEVAYYNPPGQVGKNAELTGSEHARGGADLSTDWCSSPPRFVEQAGFYRFSIDNDGFGGRSAASLDLLLGRDYVVPDDVKALVVPVLAHRVIVTADAVMSGRTAQAVLEELVSEVPVPVTGTA